MRPKIVTTVAAAAVLLLGACQAAQPTADFNADQTTQLLEAAWGPDGNPAICALWEQEGQERILEELDAGDKVTEIAVVEYFQRNCE